jgi:hypothetical protein
MKNKQHDVTKEIKEFITLISRNFVYEKSIGSINCKTVGVIYCILCTECEKSIYVGQTGDKFYQRMLLNFSKIKTQKVKDSVGKQFCQKKHCVKNSRLISERCGLTAFLSGSLLHIYEKQTT